jgi:hypothetical protein
MCTGRVGSSCAARHVTLVTYPVINYEEEKDQTVIATHGTYVLICDT